MTTVTYHVPAISCKHCVHTIKTELGDLEGVQSVDASAETKDVTVIYDAPVTPEEIEKLLVEINYPPQK